MSFTIQIAKVKGDSPLRIGEVSPPLSGPTLIGRARDCDIVLADRSISSHHLSLERHEGAFVVTNLSHHGATYVEKTQLDAERTCRFPGDAIWIQLGRVLLRVEAAPDTLPVSEMMSLPDPAEISSPPLLAVRRGAHLEVWLNGRPQSLYPSAARLLRRLCEGPGTVVTYDELMRAVDPEDHLKAGGANVSQLVTYVRNMFGSALDDAVIEQNRLAERLSGHASEPRDRADQRGLLRHLVENVRGVGYRLNLSPADVDVLEPSAPPPRSEP